MVDRGLTPLRDFVIGMADLVTREHDEARLVAQGRLLLATLVSVDDWLPEAFARPDSARYQQYLLHCDSRERFSVVSFVWGPGQGTPVHDHRVWGLVGMLRGAERVEDFVLDQDGRMRAAGAPRILDAGEVDAVGPEVGDIHRVANALADQPSISIHVYGANIGAIRRATYESDGAPRTFISGYVNDVVPNIWGNSVHS